MNLRMDDCFFYEKYPSSVYFVSNILSYFKINFIEIESYIDKISFTYFYIGAI